MYDRLGSSCGTCRSRNGRTVHCGADEYADPALHCPRDLSKTLGNGDFPFLTLLRLREPYWEQSFSLPLILDFFSVKSICIQFTAIAAHSHTRGIGDREQHLFIMSVLLSAVGAVKGVVDFVCALRTNI